MVLLSNDASAHTSVGFSGSKMTRQGEEVRASFSSCTACFSASLSVTGAGLLYLVPYVSSNLLVFRMSVRGLAILEYPAMNFL